MCWLAPVLRDEDASIPKTDEGKIIPDLGVYAEWFDQADQRRQKLAVGVERYHAASEIVGEPQWVHFVEPDTGRLMTIVELQAESPMARAARLTRVRGMLVP